MPPLSSSFDGCIHLFKPDGEERLFKGPKDAAGVPTLDPFYRAQHHQRSAHESTAPNLLCLGTRGTGKSKWLRMDAILRCLLFDDFHALIVRRTMPQLRKSHLRFIGKEVELLGGTYNQTNFTAKFPNGSTITFTHCENEKDLLDLLSSEYGFIGFDELSTFTLEQFLLFSASARAPEGAGYVAVVRASSNPLGLGAEWMQSWFITHDVDLAEYPDYNPDDFEMQFSTLEDNKYINRDRYKARLANLPEHVRKAWLDGEFVIQGTYFSDFTKVTRKDTCEGVPAGRPWHVIKALPTWQGQPLLSLPWLSIYRMIDWGYSPDPAVCLWLVKLPNNRGIVFKERTWKKTLAGQVAKDIKADSAGMHIVESFCDPTMNIKEGQDYSIGEIFEQNGVPVTAGTNDRILYGYSVHEQLNTLIDGLPQIQIVEHACPELIKTFPTLKMDKNDPRKLGDGNDHYVVALAYYCMGQAPPSKDPKVSTIPKWMVPKARSRR